MDGIKKERSVAIDKLRKEMLMNIRNVKTEMLTMNEEQLQGTTKMTVNQNVQLTSELEYQSKNTEELSFENEKMKDQIKLLKIELIEHREVEKELAKRSHFCTRVIQKYKAQITMLKEEIDVRRPVYNENTSVITDNITSKMSRSAANKQNKNGSYKNDLSQFLQKRI